MSLGRSFSSQDAFEQDFVHLGAETDLPIDFDHGNAAGVFAAQLGVGIDIDLRGSKSMADEDFDRLVAQVAPLARVDNSRMLARSDFVSTTTSGIGRTAAAEQTRELRKQADDRLLSSGRERIVCLSTYY
nr:hypothetical protein [Pirellula staleyi]